jgi:zinc metalloprotease ZmpA
MKQTMISRFLKLSLIATAALSAGATAWAAKPAAEHPRVQQALAHLRAFAADAHAAAGDSFVTKDLVQDADGSSHVRFTRTHQGLRVIGGDLIVHSDAAGGLRSMSKTLASPLALDVRPSIAAADAQAHAAAAFAGRRDASRAELVIYARGGQALLAYDVTIAGAAADGSSSIAHLIIDAHRLTLLDRWDDVQTADAVGTGQSLLVGVVDIHTDRQSDGTYALRDLTRGGHAVYDLKNRFGDFISGRGELMRDADNQWGDGIASKTSQSDGVDAQYGQSVTWDLYQNVFGRNGIADDGRGGYSRVHWGGGFFAGRYNAAWNDSCFCMTYTSGQSNDAKALVSLDIVGHEMTHGVTSSTAGLIYAGESGGLNEGTSDIMGTMVEFFAHNDADPGDYDIGEQSGSPLRNMYRPSQDGASADCYYPGVGRLNVHYSSGVANHFFFLLAEGSASTRFPASPTCTASDERVATGNDRLERIGRRQARAIWYRALTAYMTDDTTYAGARAATLSAAADLYGAGSAAEKAVARAWSAVNVK